MTETIRNLWKPCTTFLAALLASASLAADSNPGESHEHHMQAGPADKPTPSIRISKPSAGAVLTKGDVELEVSVKDIKIEGQKATERAKNPTIELPKDYGNIPQEPNSGHIHVYLAGYGELKPTKFLMVDALTGPTEGKITLKDVPSGEYRLFVELVTHDHRPRLKDHPNDFPPCDMINVTVK